MCTANVFQAFAGHKYLNLETFRNTGKGVRTPVWFAEVQPGPTNEGNGALYVYTIGNSGKAKRIRKNPRVRIAPCDFRGRLCGEWVEGRAEILRNQKAVQGMQLLNKKYAPWKQVLDLFALFRRREHIVFIIRPA
jgi:PPOX class probable F420-dependent enzyme